MTLSDIENLVRKKRFVRIIPFIFVLYIITFLDRVNISYAALTMTQDLHFTAAIFGLGAGVFFIGYFVLEIPVTAWMQKWSARKWVARIMIGWGIVSVLTAFINTENQFYALRFALGLGEAGFFPGIILYISHWFTGREKAVAYSMFMAAVPVSQIIGAPLSTHILSVDWLDMQGWRWLFILEGIPSVALGLFAFFYLTDKPSQAKWLSEDEKKWFESKMSGENKIKNVTYGFSWKRAVRERDVILLVLVYFFWIIGFYGLGFFLPTIIKGIGNQSITSVGYLVTIPYVAAFAGLVLVGRSSDKKNERKWHAFFSLVVGAIGLGLSIMVYPNLVLSMIMFTIATVGIYSAFGPFWSLPTIFLTETSAAVSIGLINSIGNLGGFIGPFIVGYLKTSTDSYNSGSIFLVASLLVAAFLLLAIKKTKNLSPSE